MIRRRLLLRRRSDIDPFSFASCDDVFKVLNLFLFYLLILRSMDNACNVKVDNGGLARFIDKKVGIPNVVVYYACFVNRGQRFNEALAKIDQSLYCLVGTRNIDWLSRIHGSNSCHRNS